MHTQAPATQTVPAPQAGPLPQAQVPVVASQLSLLAVLHAMHARPATPQVVAAGTLQAPPAQQPPGQELALHTQAPATQTVPAPQAAPAPQWHSPVAAQLSARAPSHITHAAPPMPQLVVEGIMQVEPEQQPCEQVVGLQSAQAPPAQMRPPQSWQAAPPLPQLLPLVPGRQVLPAQHPLPHEVRSHTHTAPTQRWPAPHGAPAPHWQAPVAEQRSALPAAHAPQVAPPIPQASIVVGILQVLPAQQPLGHEKASHTQAPATQRCPLPQAAPVPHAQLPAAVQLSAATESQVTQTAPVAPQRVSDRDTQVAPSQHPVGHEAVLHTQWPPTQRWPDTHDGPPPHPQAPPAEQPSARVVSQPTHTAPPLPQAATEGLLQVAPEQQPPGQLIALHPLQRPAPQVCPAGQVSQAPPPAPHDAAVLPATHIPCAQHPLGQDVPSHTQVLARQRCPTAQTAPLPQRQPPVAEQLSERASQAKQVAPAVPQLASERVTQVVPLQQPLGHEVASHTQPLVVQRWPAAQAAPAPHEHAPVALHRLAVLLSQATHAAPLAPQVASAGALHTAPLQQPVGHEVASQTQAPPVQRWPLAQGGPPPQRQAPCTEQVSALLGSQAMQIAAAIPHADSERG